MFGFRWKQLNTFPGGKLGSSIFTSSKLKAALSFLQMNTVIDDVVHKREVAYKEPAEHVIVM